MKEQAKRWSCHNLCDAQALYGWDTESQAKGIRNGRSDCARCVCECVARLMMNEAASKMQVDIWNQEQIDSSDGMEVLCVMVELRL